jgi:hypothetical protein
VAMGIRVAIAHSDASTEQIADAVRAGATMSTHLGNGCPATLPRHPNVIWDQLATDALLASLIVDGHHLPPATVSVMVRAKSPARCLLVTDAMMAAGAAPGTYRLAHAGGIGTHDAVRRGTYVSVGITRCWGGLGHGLYPACSVLRTFASWRSARDLERRLQPGRGSSLQLRNH